MNTPMWIAVCTAVATLASAFAWNKGYERGSENSQGFYDLGRSVNEAMSQHNTIVFARLCMGLLDVAEETQMEVMQAAAQAIQEQAQEDALVGTADDLEKLYKR